MIGVGVNAKELRAFGLEEKRSTGVRAAGHDSAMTSLSSKPSLMPTHALIYDYVEA